MGAVGNDNGEMIVCYAAAPVQIIHQRGNDLVLPHPEAGHVADDQRNALTGLYPAGKRGHTDRRVQHAGQRRGNILNGRNLVAVQLAQHMGLIQRKRHGAVAVTKNIILHAFIAPA